MLSLLSSVVAEMSSQQPSQPSREVTQCVPFSSTSVATSHKNKHSTSSTTAGIITRNLTEIRLRGEGTEEVCEQAGVLPQVQAIIQKAGTPEKATLAETTPAETTPALAALTGKDDNDDYEVITSPVARPDPPRIYRGGYQYAIVDGNLRLEKKLEPVQDDSETKEIDGHWHVMSTVGIFVRCSNAMVVNMELNELKGRDARSKSSNNHGTNGGTSEEPDGTDLSGSKDDDKQQSSSDGEGSAFQESSDDDDNRKAKRSRTSSSRSAS